MDSELLKNHTVEFLINPDGSSRLLLLETKKVMKPGREDTAALIWYFEDEKKYIVELEEEDELKILEYPTIDALLADDWVLFS